MSIFAVIGRKGALALAAVAVAALFAVDTGSAPAQSGTPQVAAITPGQFRLGIYDPAGAFGGEPNLSLEHIYLPLIGVDIGSLRQAASYAAARHRDLMITVEPWSWDGRWNLANEQAIEELVAGRFDKQIVSLCTAMGQLPTSAIIRWGHEMEAKTDRYAWTMLPPKDYIEGYRHFVTLCREYAPTAQYMWSPLGEPDLANYYPGDDVVDVIGFSVFALQPYEREHTGHDRNIDEIAKERYDRVLKYLKPIYIAELGCDGDDDYVLECLRELHAMSGKLPKLAGVAYFNDVEPVNWPGYGRPDWRLPPDAFDVGN